MECTPYWFPLPSEIDDSCYQYENYYWGVWREDPYNDNEGGEA